MFLDILVLSILGLFFQAICFKRCFSEGSASLGLNRNICASLSIEKSKIPTECSAIVLSEEEIKPYILKRENGRN